VIVQDKCAVYFWNKCSQKDQYKHIKCFHFSQFTAIS